MHSADDDDGNQTIQKRLASVRESRRFLKQEDAIDYATGRACFRSGEIQILDSTGNVERVIPFDDANRKL
jgi:hypothetical protein